MDVRELVTRFPEIPADLHGEPVLARFAEAFGDMLRVARNPSPCTTQHDATHHYYRKLIGPISIYGYGLSNREKLLAELEALLNDHRADPDGFVRGLLPAGTAQTDRGPEAPE